MKISDLFHITFENFKNRKSRTAFTILGLSIGIGAILFLVSLGYGLQHMLLERITTAESLLTFTVASPDPDLISLNKNTLTEIEKLKNVERVSPKAVFPGQVSLGELTSETSINLIDYNYFTLGGIIAQEGRFFKEDRDKEVVVNSSIAELLNLKPEQVIGETLYFTFFILEGDNGSEVSVIEVERGFQVVGVIDGTGVPGEIYLDREELLEIPVQEYQLAKVKMYDEKGMDFVREELIVMGFMVSALSDIIVQANQIFGVIQLVLGIFGVVALVVAAIGLINTMTISLLERTSDIGIMRSIGSSPGDIKKIFLIESTIIGFLGGLVGIIIGFLGAKIFNILINILARTLGGEAVSLFYYPLWFIFFIILLSTAVGLIAGYWPAKKASKLNPLEALRYK